MGKENEYKYPGSSQVFILSHFGNNGNAYFKCGHWCTDNVFEDLINIKTGLAKWQIPEQLTLF